MKAGVIHKPEYGYDIGNFVNTQVCILEKGPADLGWKGEGEDGKGTSSN